MALDNDGESFEFISIATLESTSDAIIQPSSRPYGYDPRLTRPLPHPYGSIGEARPTTMLVINTGPRPGAPIRQRHGRPLGTVAQPSSAVAQIRQQFRNNVAAAMQREAIPSAPPLAPGPVPDLTPVVATAASQGDQGGASSEMGGPNTVGPHTLAFTKDQALIMAAAAAESEGPSRERETWTAAVPPIVIDNASAVTMEPDVDPTKLNEPYDGDDGLEGEFDAPHPDQLTSEPLFQRVLEEASSPIIEFRLGQCKTPAPVLQTSLPRCALHIDAMTTLNTRCSGCLFLINIANAGRALTKAPSTKQNTTPTPSPRCALHVDSTISFDLACSGCLFLTNITNAGRALRLSHEQGIATIEQDTEYPNYSATMCPTDDFRSGLPEVIEFQLGPLPGVAKDENGRGIWYGRPEADVEWDRLWRMEALSREVEARRG